MPSMGEYQKRRAELADAINRKFDEQDARFDELEGAILDTQEGVADIYSIIEGEGE